MIWFGWILWHNNYCRLFKAKFPLYMYIKHIYDWCQGSDLTRKKIPKLFPLKDRNGVSSRRQCIVGL